MEKGKQGYTGVLPGIMMSLMASVCLIAPAAGETAKSTQGITDGLREEGAGGDTWVAPVFYVDVMPTHIQSKPVNIILHFVNEDRKVQPALPQSRIVQRYAHGESGERWYAVAGAGSGTLALLSPALVEQTVLRLQKRTKIGTAQLGMARDMGSARVTLGYLRHDDDRNDLVPFYTGTNGQNLAAMTLTLKH